MKKNEIFGIIFLIILIIMGCFGVYYLYLFSLNIKWVDLLPFLVLLLLIIIIIFQIFIFKRFNPPEQKGKDDKSDNKFSSAQLRSYQYINNEKITFDDVAGLNEAKNECKRILKYLNHSDKFQKLGAKMPKGFIFEGPPGMGKTFLAKALANEADVPFYYISAAELIELFVGVGAGRIRSIFHVAKQNKPCIVFIDELDAVAQKRSPIPSFSPGADEREQTINQLLACLDGVDSSEGIIVIAATNRIEVIDPALTRPGRFDSTIHVELKSPEERAKLIDITTESMVISSTISSVKMASKMKDFSGAEIVVMCNRAALLAGEEGSAEIGSRHFESSISFMTDQRKFESSIDKIFQMAMNSTFRVKEKYEIEVDTFSKGQLNGFLIWISPDSIKLETKIQNESVEYIIPRGSISSIKEIKK
jgi:cell division protease FtsH